MCLCVCSLCRPKCIQYVDVCVYENVSVSLTAPVYVVGVKGGIYIYTHGIWACGTKTGKRCSQEYYYYSIFFGRWARVEEIMHI